MSKIFNNQAGVQAQGRTIGAWAREAEQSASNYVTRSDTHQNGLDGAARLRARELSCAAEQAVKAACETAQNLRAFLENASQTTVSLDQAQSANFRQLEGSGD